MNNITQLPQGKYVKIPDGFCYQARARNLFKQSLHFFHLKANNKSGFYSEDNVLKEFKPVLHKSEAQCRRILQALVKCKFIRVQSNGYVLASYNTFYKLLGYKMGYNITHEGKVRLGTFKIHKKHISCLEQLKLFVQYLDIKVNINKQARYSQSKLDKDKRFECPEPAQRKLMQKKSGLTVKEYLKSIVLENVARIVEFNDESQRINEFCEETGKRNPFIYCNPDCTLSLRGIVKLLNLSSVSSAWKLLEDLKKHGFIELEKRDFYVADCPNYESFLSSYDPRKFRFRNGFVYRVQANLITPL